MATVNYLNAPLEHVLMVRSLHWISWGKRFKSWGNILNHGKNILNHGENILNHGENILNHGENILVTSKFFVNDTS